jgi:guanylate kinase
MILTLTGASGAGKTTIAKRLIETLPQTRFLLSSTTRSSRPSDLPGEYEYLDHKTFDQLRADGHFAWTAAVGTTSHGTRHNLLRDALENPTTISIMILVPEVLQKLYAFAEEIGKRDAIVSFLVRTLPEPILRARMHERGDVDAQIDERIIATLAYETSARATGISFFEISNAGTIEETMREVLGALERRA